MLCALDSTLILTFWRRRQWDYEIYFGSFVFKTIWASLSPEVILSIDRLHVREIPASILSYKPSTMPFGTLKTNAAKAIPVHSPSYPGGTISFSDVDVLKIGFYTKADAVKDFIPEELELEDEPLVTYTLNKWGFSSIGPYTEFIGLIEVKYKGEKYDYALELILDNEGAIFLGREQYGFPKVVGKVDFDRAGTASTSLGFIHGHVERPVGRSIIQFAFKAEEKLHGVTSLPPPEKRLLSLRIIPSPVIGKPPVVREFLSLYSHFTEGEVWTGTGSLQFTPTSDFELATKIPVVRYQDAMLLTKTMTAIDPDVKIFPL